MTSKIAQSLKQPALDFLSFVNASPTRNYITFYTILRYSSTNFAVAFHAVQSAKELLAKAGFQEIKVCDSCIVSRN